MWVLFTQPWSHAAESALQKIEASRYFQAAVIFIIVLSALSIGAKTYDLAPAAESFLFFAAIDEVLWGMFPSQC